MAEGRSGAARQVLDVLADLVRRGEDVRPAFQRLANFVLLQAIDEEKLPPKAKGRQKSDDGGTAWKAAFHYYALVDGGTSSDEAAARLSEQLHVDPRHVMRLVAKGRKLVGETRERRQSNRDWWAMCAAMDEKAKQEWRDGPLDVIESIVDDTVTDQLETLDERFQDALKAACFDDDMK